MGKLKAGVGAAEITPPIGIEMASWACRTGLCQGIHDRSYARAVVLNDGQTPVAIVSVDVGGLSEAVIDDIRDLAARQVPIPKGNIVVNSSHTHTGARTGRGSDATLSAGSRAYGEAFPHYVAGAVMQAWHYQQDAAIGSASTMVTGVTTNRRNPKLPVDPELGVIRVDGQAGQPLACLVSYTCHGVAVGAHHLEWTADWPGYLARTLEGAIPGCQGQFLQGAAGDIHPWDWYFGNENPRWDDHYQGAERLGKAVAGPALGLFHEIKTEPSAQIGIVTKTIGLPPRPIKWTAEEVEAYIAHLKATTEEYREPVIPDDCPGCMSAQRFPNPYRLRHASREAQFARNYPEKIYATLSALRINDIVLALNPGELYNELGQQIKQRSPAEKTFILSYTNGSIGYIPTRQAAEKVLDLPFEEWVDPVRHRNDYGATASTRLSPSAGEMVVEEALQLINQVYS